MWSISYDTSYIVNFIKQISTNNPKIGIICLFSDFEKINEAEEPFYNSLLNESEKDLFDKKRLFSLKQFLEEYPDSFKESINQSTQIRLI